MKMEIFEYQVLARTELVAGFNDLDRAIKYAQKVCKREHCDVNVVNAFTGEIHKSYCSYLHVTYNEGLQEIEKYYEVKEREW
jgi:hypothetical protein